MVYNNSLSLSTLDFIKSVHPFPTHFTRDIHPVPRHSHNGGWRHISLFDAISVGYPSVEADAWISISRAQTANTQKLYVGHSICSLTSDSTLRRLYLDLLLYILDKLNDNDQGTERLRRESEEYVGIFEASPSSTLILAVSSKEFASRSDVWGLLQKHLQPFRERNYLAYWDRVGKGRVLGTLTIVVTGDASFNLLSSSKTTQKQDIFFDTPLDSLQFNSDRDNSIYSEANPYYARA
jgi:hypothetical protein